MKKNNMKKAATDKRAARSIPHREKRTFLYTRAAVIFFCTVVGGYGIWHAPESDEAEMKQELLQHEQTLLQENSPLPSLTPQQATPSAVSAEETFPQTIAVIGDSVFLGAAPSFQKIQKNAVIDAKISRQVRHGLEVAEKLDKKGKLGKTVLISLGTNGEFNPATGQELIDYLGTQRTIYWISAYGKNLEFQDEVNGTIQALAKKNENVHLIAWDKEAKKHPDWFYQDGTHLNPKGQDGFAQFIKSRIEVN